MSTQPVLRARRERRILVFNPSHLADDVQVFGDFYHFEPFSVGTCSCARHNAEGAKDNVGIHAKYEHARNEKNHLILDAPMKVAGEGECTADRVAEFVVSADGRGAKKFVILDGNAEEQERQKREAIEGFVSFFMPLCEQQIADWEAQLASIRATSPGAKIPRQPTHVTAAYAYREKYRYAIEEADRGQIVCLFCGFRTPDEAQLANHTQLEHPSAPAPAVAAPPAARVTPMPPRPVPVPQPAPVAEEEEEFGTETSVGTAPVNEPNDMGSQPRLAETEVEKPTAPASMAARNGIAYVRRLIANAESVGLELSVGDKLGLETRNLDVIKDVQARLQAMGGKK